MSRFVRTRCPLAPIGLLMLASLLVLLSGCAAQPQATPTPTKTPRVAAPPTTPAPQAPAAPVTDTPAPTVQPAPSATPAPTVTPAALAPQAPATPEPTQPPTPDPNLIVPANDPGISPFTGLRPADPSVLQRRPLAIKITNDADAQQKQSDLNKADIIVESRVEYSETRLTAIYQSQDAPRVGPIRSARLIDIELPAIFDAVLCFSGGVEPVRQKLYDSDLGDHILEQALHGASFFRDMSVGGVSWNTLFANTTTLWDTSTQRGWNVAPQSSAAWVFSVGAPAGSKTASRIDLAYPRFKVAWVYDSGTGRWQRWSGGQPHMDQADGQQVSAANIVVLGANHVVTLIVEDGTERRITDGICINCSIEIQLWGEGPLKILRDDKVYEGKWLRPERHAPFRFVDAAGVDIPLKPGNSWWQVVPLDMQVTVNP